MPVSVHAWLRLSGFRVDDIGGSVRGLVERRMMVR
jgi:hypothetical protein